MDNLKDAFEDEPDRCERHLEDKQGRAIGMTFGVMLRACGRLARFPARLEGEGRTATVREFHAGAEKLPLEPSTRFLVTYGWIEKRSRLLEPISMRTNMTYVTRLRPQERPGSIP